MSSGALVGVDVVEIPRIVQALSVFGERFLARLFSEEELAFYRGKSVKRWYEGVAALFASKEAVKKLFLQRGIPLCFRDISILHDPSGEPKVMLRRGNEAFIKISLSFAHGRDVVVAVAVGVYA
ncbi:MAG: 4'-phosphopantetheinyl transferase superfamily protein [Candidatus Caldatribacterium sp.]|uniref:holo-ACP synthase n=1 Tax=Candidatus Caldatribacterium sp. TaxID=2282143 RepID=UPI00299B5AEE|nr:4'-phosphopantetheinyl transferase superfamily protein [Candidatus Caldatribacterium sp.]MCX7731388.1 4'-phosphopantetheinyl transferase superfamily protein [Candidatus Caldatribacterium sp.]MDW8080902.1 4'-phosphopantetheinyl transferase superfamily protein [Candidatus Calescibacterium sp.]